MHRYIGVSLGGNMLLFKDDDGKQIMVNRHKFFDLLDQELKKDEKIIYRLIDFLFYIPDFFISLFQAIRKRTNFEYTPDIRDDLIFHVREIYGDTFVDELIEKCRITFKGRVKKGKEENERRKEHIG